MRIKVFLKYLALLFQAIFPAVIVICTAHLTSLPVSEWRWLEYLIAIPLIGFAGMTATLAAWRLALWLRNLAMNRHADNS